MIPEGHLVRVVDEMIERLKIGPLKRQYKWGGTSAYHPKLLLKVPVYVYTQQTFSSWKITQAPRENIIFLWLSGMSQPDHRTINRFRGVVMKQVVEEVFYGVVEQLLEMGLVDLERYFVDGTKIEASANRCSFMRRKNREKNKVNLQKKVKKLLDQIDELEEEGNRRCGGKDYPEVEEGVEIDVEEMKNAADKLSRRLGKDPQVLIADAGYVSEENYAAGKKITPYVKYNHFHEEQKRSYRKKNPYRQYNFRCLIEKHQYQCPEGKRLNCQFTKEVTSYNGYPCQRRVYECEECEDCAGCPVKEDCTRSKYNRRWSIGEELRVMRKKDSELLQSSEGVKLRSQRPIGAEAVCGRLKHNCGFRRYLLR